MPTSPFLLRRVLLGVLVGVLLCGLAVFGWTAYRTAQYHAREATVLSRYHHTFERCLAASIGRPACEEQIMRACTADEFWRRAEPFTLDLGHAFSEPGVRCRHGAVG